MKKGFTLIELLAVIIILGILTTLIAPKVVNMIEEAEKNTNMTSAQNLAKAAQLKAQNNDAAGTNENIIINYETGENANYLDYNGSKPEKGQVKITSSGEISMAVKIGDNCYIKNFDTQEIKMEKYNEETCKNTVLFTNDSWKTIIANLNIDRHAYDDQIGLEKEIEVDDTSYTVRLVNTSSCPSDWMGSETTCGVVIEFVDTILDNTRDFPFWFSMNTSDISAGGWPETSIRNYLNTTFLSMLPDELKGIILNTKVISGHDMGPDTENYISIDKLYLLSYVEVWGTNYEYDTLKLVSNETPDGTKQLEYYGKADSTRNKIADGHNNSWWLRSADYGTNVNFLGVDDEGNVYYNYATTGAGVAPAFRIMD